MAINRKQKGDSGLNTNAINTNRSVEYLVELQGRDGSVRYQKMSRSDGQVGMLLRSHKNPIKSANWTIEAPEDAEDSDVLAIEVFNKWVFEDSELTFDTTLSQILSFLEYGFACFEIIWSVYEYKGQKYLMPSLHQRMQTSIQDIFPQKGHLTQSTIENGLVEIPLDDMVFFTLNQQGEDMRGESILRNAYDAWKRKTIYKEYMGIGIQRSTSGIPAMKIPKGTKVTSANYISAEALLQNISFHENAYMITEEGWDFTIHESKFNSEQVQKAIDSQNSEMALSVLAQFMLLGQQGKGGAYALSRDQSDFFLDGLQYVVKIIEQVFHKRLIMPFVKLNFGDSVDCDNLKLKGLNLNKKAGKELSEVISTLSTSGFLKATIDDEVQLRKSLELTELSEYELAKRKEARDNPPPPPTIIDPKKVPVEVKKELKKEDKNVKLSEKRLKERKVLVDQTIKEVRDFMKANLLMIKDKYMADIESTLKRGIVDIKGLKNIQISSNKYRRDLERKLSGIAVDSWDRARASAKSNNIKLAEDKNPKDIENKKLKQFVLNESQSIVDQQTALMRNQAILTASNGSLKGFSVGQTLANVGIVIDNFIEGNSVMISGSLVVVGTDNFGANEFNRQIDDQLWGYAFVSVDDGNTTQICSFYSGKTYSSNSTELGIVTPPLHPNCRSFLDPIYKTQEKPESIDNVIAPPSIQKQKSIY